ncbi:SGNH/GDSL hydrolase family protein [Aeromicrobium duanguangcaii]|uniref:SGNH/GDSL hydrolase family protein n=1 Tax=Aeromicrobium duanguangcaii TaxID=2968086 RepID=UPI0020176989|nr:SGNH/GDSL hydrolase family protein [Aeromicrobium duanguangcaii]MCL3839123.1 SGNH/GDSL hydrolase family protein [Aeromicrobium duanguangcaii]
MSVSARRRLTATAALALVAPLLALPAASATNAVSPVWDHTAPGEHYVALGDSFVAGPGIMPARDAGCGRSELNLPTLVATELSVASFTDASCSAARTTHLWASQQANATLNPPQLNAIGPETTLVTLGPLGGNDLDAPGLAWTCVTVGCSDLPTQPNHDAIDALTPTYRRVIAEVRQRAPHARIFALGYGHFVPAQACERLGQASDADLGHLQALADRLSDMIGRVAAEEDVPFVDLRAIEGWDEHSACADPADQWMRGLDALDDGGAPLHPSALGMTVMAAHTLEAIRRPVLETPAPPIPRPTTSRPVVAPRPPSSAQRLTAAASSVRVRARCIGPRKQRRVRLSVNGGQGLVRQTTFRIGKRWSAIDRRAPFTTTRRVSALRRAKVKGPVRATVTLRHGTAQRTTTVTVRLPSCLR